MSNLASMLVATAARAPGQPALRLGDRVTLMLPDVVPPPAST
ncbi:hypothetical protein ABZ807_18500 [Micromonospora sp. NPDC047548]